MPSVHFYLKKPVGPLPWCLIYLQFKYNGKKLVYSFGQKINPVDWSKTQKRVKSNRQTILDGQYAINELLDKLEKLCIRAYQEEMLKGVPPVSVLRFRLDAFVRQNKGRDKTSGFYQLFDRFISGEIKNKGRDKSPDTLRNYATTRDHLRQFDVSTRYHVGFENINLEFFDKYISFLRNELRLAHNSIAKDISVLKKVMDTAVELDYTTNIQFRHKKFSFAAQETDAVYLTVEEIGRLFRFDLSGHRRLARVRDLFVLGCLTNTDPIVTEILTRYSALPGGLPAPPSNQKFNAYIKEACRLAGLALRGPVTSHTARRSLASNSYLAGSPIHEIMKTTGHRTEKAFLDYIRARRLDTLHSPTPGSTAR